MRLHVTLELNREVAIPMNYQYALAGAIYRFLESSDADYAHFLHEEGYAPDERGTPNTERGASIPPSAVRVPRSPRRRFKLFTFSFLYPAHSRVESAPRPQDARLWLELGRVHWWISSPVEAFLVNFASGLLASHTLQIGAQHLPIAGVETLPAPEFHETMRFKCLSPIIVAVHDPQRRTPRYLRPDDPEFSECVRQNLLHKYAALYGGHPADDRLTLEFDADYLARHRGTKTVLYKDDIQLVGAFCPFVLTGSTELMRVGYECGFGEKNSNGLGMVEVVDR